MKYNASLDGLRAVAVGGVLAFHLAPQALRGGFTGVDVFYVLSGYLITSILVRDLAEGRFSLREFYLRRAQRILPNAIVATLATVLVARLLLLPSNATQVARHAIWQLFNLSNVFTYRFIGSYWGDSAVASPLLHTWSLAVEEQFYLLFPLSLLLVWRRWPKGVAAILGFAGLISYGFFITRAATDPTATFYLLPARLWELLLGSTVAVIRARVSGGRPKSRRVDWISESFGWFGLALIVAGFVRVSELPGRWNFLGFGALAPTFGTLLVLVAIAEERTSLSVLLGTSPLALIGKLSYSLYLWHWPLIVIGRSYADLAGLPRPAGTLAGFCASVVAASLAYRFVERPLRVNGGGRNRRLVLIGSLLAVALVWSTVLARRKPIADPDHRFDPVRFSGLAYTAAQRGGVEQSRLARAIRYRDVEFPAAADRPRELWRTGGVIHRWGGSVPRVVVLGSSHALMYAHLVDELCRERHVSIAFLSVDGSSVFFAGSRGTAFTSTDDARAFDTARRGFLSAWKPDLVIAVDRWDTYVGQTPGLADQLRSFVLEVERAARSVLFFSQVPVLELGEDLNLREYVTWKVEHAGELPEIRRSSFDSVRLRANQTLENVAGEFSRVKVLRVESPFVGPGGSVRWHFGRQFAYADDDHLSEAGAETVRSLVSQAIDEALVGPGAD